MSIYVRFEIQTINYAIIEVKTLIQKLPLYSQRAVSVEQIVPIIHVYIKGIIIQLFLLYLY